MRVYLLYIVGFCSVLLDLAVSASKPIKTSQEKQTSTAQIWNNCSIVHKQCTSSTKEKNECLIVLNNITQLCELDETTLNSNSDCPELLSYFKNPLNNSFIVDKNKCLSYDQCKINNCTNILTISTTNHPSAKLPAIPNKGFEVENSKNQDSNLQNNSLAKNSPVGVLNSQISSGGSAEKKMPLPISKPREIPPTTPIVERPAPTLPKTDLNGKIGAMSPGKEQKGVEPEPQLKPKDTPDEISDPENVAKEVEKTPYHRGEPINTNDEYDATRDDPSKDDDDDENNDGMDQGMEAVEPVTSPVAVVPNKEEPLPVGVNGGDPFQETPDSHFFVYFLFFTCVSVMGYIAFHNKNKILALALEGRRGRQGRRRPNSSSYRKLDSSLEEVMMSHPSRGSPTQVIF